MKRRTQTKGWFSTAGITFFVLVILFLFLGTIFIFESSVGESLATFNDKYFLVKRHLLGVAIGSLAGIVGYLIPLAWWKKFAPHIFVGTIGLLFLVFVPGIGLELNGAKSWLHLGPIIIQPVEILKFSLIVYLASWLSSHQKFNPFLLTLGIPTVLIMLQPDLGSLMIVLSIGIGLYFVANGSLKKLSILAAIGIPLVLIAILASPYRMKRLTTFINPESDPLGASFHIRQITLALARGGWFGQGIGKSNQKYAYIPEASTDSVFAIIAEEVGFIGSSIIIILFMIFLQCIYIISKKKDITQQQQLLLLGIFIWFAAQIILNLSAIVGLVPLTGAPIPFFSYGRSALIMVLFASGIILRIDKQT